MATTSNISSTWTPGQLGNCCEKCGPMGLFCAVFPQFCSMQLLLRRFLNDGCKIYIFSPFLAYIFLSFPPPPLHWARLRALELT